MNLYGRDTLKFKREVTKLNKICKIVRKKEDERHVNQLEHLKKKHQGARRQRQDPIAKKYIPKWKEKFKGATIYQEEQDDEAFQKLLRDADREHQEETVLNIGEADLNAQEEQLLNLPPGMSTNPKLSENTFDNI